MKTKDIKIHIEITSKFFAILPALNINFGAEEIEFEWLWVGIYIKLIDEQLWTK